MTPRKHPGIITMLVLGFVQALTACASWQLVPNETEEPSFFIHEADVVKKNISAFRVVYRNSTARAQCLATDSVRDRAYDFAVRLYRNGVLVPRSNHYSSSTNRLKDVPSLGGGIEVVVLPPGQQIETYVFLEESYSSLPSGDYKVLLSIVVADCQAYISNPDPKGIPEAVSVQRHMDEETGAIYDSINLTGLNVVDLEPAILNVALTPKADRK